MNYDWVSAAANWEINPIPDFGDGDDSADNWLLLLLLLLYWNCKFFSA